MIEGIGLTRPTKNFDQALIDDSFKVTDLEALHMAYYLIENEGLFVGGSCAVNLAGVVKYCRLNPSSKVVTIIHDSGSRYLKKFYSELYLKQRKIEFKKREQYPADTLDFIS